MKKSDRVLVLLFNNFSNDSRVLKECTTLVECGYHVELWAYFDPNLPQSETINGFVVKRKLLIPKKGVGSAQTWVKRIKKLKSWILHYPVKLIKTNALIYGPTKKYFNKFESFIGHLLRLVLSRHRIRKAVVDVGKQSTFDFDIIHCNDLHPLELGVKIKKQYPHLKIVYDSHEFQTETPKLNASPPAKKHAQELEKSCITFASEMITVSQPIADAYQKMYDLKAVHVVKNCPPRLTTRPLSTDYFRNYFKIPADELVFLYQGALKQSRGVGEILDCFTMLFQKGYQSKHLVFMGYGPYEKEIQERCKTFTNIHFHPSVKMDDLPKISNSADYGIIFTQDTCKNHTYSLPNKLFEYIAFGLPVIVSPLETMQKLVEEEQIGFVANGFQPENLYEKIKDISVPPATELRDVLWKLHTEKYNWDIEKQVLINLYKNL